MNILENLKIQLSGKDGKKRNAIRLNASEASELDNDIEYMLDDDLEGVKYIALVCCEGAYDWVAFNTDSDWKTLTHSEKLEEQVSEEDAYFLLKYGNLLEGAGEV